MSLNLFLTHSSAQIACYESKGYLSPRKLRNYKDLYVKPCKCDWMAKVVFLIQMLPTFGSHCNHCFFWGIGLKILRLPNLNMLFQPLLCFHDYRKLITWSSHAKSLLNGTTIMIAYGQCKWWAHLKHNKAVFALHIAHLKEIPK